MIGWTALGWTAGAGVAFLLAYDLTQRKKAILSNFPVLGHLRYLLIRIGPELRQYIVAGNREEAPFDRSEREWIERSAENRNNYFGFGTDDQPYGIGYPIIKHAVLPLSDYEFTGSSQDAKVEIPCAKVIGAWHARNRPYQPSSIINISAMSFGSLGAKAIEALNRGASKATCYHNTGEGGCSPHHRHGADVCLQIGTGYFGCRTLEGQFDLDRLRELVQQEPRIRMIEIKLSQGAKPGKGGVLPGAKVTPEIARIRGVAEGANCISPNRHAAFDSVDSLVEFVERAAEATGLPVGIKTAVGQLDFFHQLAMRMKETSQGPDFIAIDGGEGGTGAAPLTFSDHISLPYKPAFMRVFSIFSDQGLADDMVWIGAGKLGFPDRAIVAMALGADLICVAREAMLSIGCIQAQKCHTGHCPTGIATHSAWLQRGLDVTEQAERFANYIEAFRKDVHAATTACGYIHPGQFTPWDVEISSGPNLFQPLAEVCGYDKKQFVPGEEPRIKGHELQRT